MASNPACLAALTVLIAIFQERNILYVTVGGAALQLRYGITSVRATADVDTVVLVDAWPEYVDLLAHLRGQGWREDTAHEYRLRTPDGCVMDLLPYPLHDVEGDYVILPASRGRLSTIGWVEALLGAEEVDLPPIGRVRVPRPEHLAAVKGAAWHERGDTKDAFDVIEICRRFGDGDAIIAEVSGERATNAAQARAVLLAKAVAATVPRGVPMLRSLAAAFRDRYAALPTLIWTSHARDRDEGEFKAEMADIGTGLLRGFPPEDPTLPHGNDEAVPGHE